VLAINVKVTTKSDLFNSLADSNWKFYFDAYQETKVDKFLNISEAGSSLSLPFTSNGSEIVCSKRSFAGGFVSNFSNPEEQSRFLISGFRHLKALGYKRLIHKELPEHFGPVPGFSRWLVDDKSIDSISILETSIVRVSEFKLSNDHSRRLRKAQNNLLISQINDHSQIRVLWNYLADTLRERGLTFLPVDRVEWLVKSFPSRFLLFGTQSHSGEPTGTILVDSIYGVARLANYAASKVPEYAGSIQLFTDFFLKSKFAAQLKYLDFGTSTDPNSGQLVSSIVFFKRGFSTIESVSHFRTLAL
jgi:hypothetical protein